MTIDWNNFTPWTSLAGGLLIGLATILFLMFNGRVAGISGIVGGLLNPSRGDISWRIAFVGGLVLSPLVFALASSLPKVQVEASYPVLIVAGLLVGIGTRYGSGCTSGHGVCGLSRRSLRSMMATVTFMFAGFVIVYIVRHLVGYLRTLLIHGGRAIIRCAGQKPPTTNSWLDRILMRRHKNVATVALANRNARIVWALLAHDREFRSDYAPA